MDEPRRNAIEFLEKEIKTYMALALFFAKKGLKESVKVEGKEILLSPTFYKARMKEAKGIVSELRRSN
jgi:hypothetical protein